MLFKKFTVADFIFWNKFLKWNKGSRFSVLDMLKESVLSKWVSVYTDKWRLYLYPHQAVREVKLFKTLMIFNAGANEADLDLVEFNADPDHLNILLTWKLKIFVRQTDSLVIGMKSEIIFWGFVSAERFSAAFVCWVHSVAHACQSWNSSTVCKHDPHGKQTHTQGMQQAPYQLPQWHAHTRSTAVCLWCVWVRLLHCPLGKMERIRGLGRARIHCRLYVCCACVLWRGVMLCLVHWFLIQFLFIKEKRRRNDTTRAGSLAGKSGGSLRRDSAIWEGLWSHFGN